VVRDRQAFACAEEGLFDKERAEERTVVERKLDLPECRCSLVEVWLVDIFSFMRWKGVLRLSGDSFLLSASC